MRKLAGWGQNSVVISGDVWSRRDEVARERWPGHEYLCQVLQDNMIEDRPSDAPACRRRRNRKAEAGAASAMPSTSPAESLGRARRPIVGRTSPRGDPVTVYASINGGDLGGDHGGRPPRSRRERSFFSSGIFFFWGALGSREHPEVQTVATDGAAELSRSIRRNQSCRVTMRATMIKDELCGQATS